MPWWQWSLVAAGAVVVLSLLLVGWGLRSGRRDEVRAVAGLLPECLVLFRRLLVDRRTPKRSKVLLVAAVAYLALPVDFVPDFIPVAGQVDDVIVVALVLRSVLRAAGPDLVGELWGGPPATLGALMRFAYGRSARRRGG